MSKVDEEVISKLEQLARLNLNPSERDQISKDLNSIVKMFDRLSEVNTDDVEPLRHINVDIVNRLRDDQVDGELTQDAALSNVKNNKEGYIAVPKFLKPKS